AAPVWPGVQSMKYSPIRDCGRDWQKASEWKAPKPVVETCTVTTACMVFWSSPILVILPAGTPPTLNCSPWTRPKALSSSILYVGSLEPPPELLARVTIPATTRRATTMPARMRFIACAPLAWRVLGSLSPPQLFRVAVVLAEARIRVVRRVLHRARTAVAYAELEGRLVGGQNLAEGDRDLAGASDRERPDDRRNARVAAVRVVSARVAIALEPAGQVGRV